MFFIDLIGKNRNSSSMEEFEHLIKTWPHQSKKVLKNIYGRYGLPYEATHDMVIWHLNGPWKRTVVYRDGPQHNFPHAHKDLLEQTVDMRVLPEKMCALADFNGSIVVNRTRGEMSARCNSEGLNILMLNLAHEIVIGKKDAEEAIHAAINASSALKLHWPEPNVRELQFATNLPSVEFERATTDPG